METIIKDFLYESAELINGQYVFTKKGREPLGSLLKDIFVNRTLLAFPIVILIYLFWFIIGGVVLHRPIMKDDIQFVLFSLLAIPFAQLVFFYEGHKTKAIAKGTILSIAFSGNKCEIVYRNGERKGKKVLRTRAKDAEPRITNFFCENGESFSVIHEGKHLFGEKTYRYSFFFGLIGTAISLFCTLSPLVVTKESGLRVLFLVLTILTLGVTIWSLFKIHEAKGQIS